MEAGSTTTGQARRRGILIAGAGVLAVVAAGGTLVASGAWAATATPAAPAAPTQADQVGIEAIWSQTDPAARHSICLSHLADPDGAWQVLAPVLTAHGADRASTVALLGQECAAAATLADIRG